MKLAARGILGFLIGGPTGAVTAIAGGGFRGSGGGGALGDRAQAQGYRVAGQEIGASVVESLGTPSRGGLDASDPLVTADEMVAQKVDSGFQGSDVLLKGILNNTSIIATLTRNPRAGSLASRALGGEELPTVSKVTGRPREHGGIVHAGTRYLLGEKGPEEVEFGVSGRIRPNRSIGSAGGFQAPVIHIHGRFEGVSAPQMRHMIRTEALKVTAQLAAGRDPEALARELGMEEHEWRT